MRLRLSIVLFVLTFLSAAPRSWAVGLCDQQGWAQCGPCNGYNLTKDGGFDYDCNPPVWAFGQYTYRATSGSLSCGWLPSSAPFAQVDGPTNGWAFFWQDTPAGDGTSFGSYFGFGYTIEINDSNTSNQVYVEIVDLNTGEHWGVDYVTGAHYCDTKNILLGNHPNWKGHTLRVLFDTNLVNSASVKIDLVNFWQLDSN